jgi:hypothetical protein
MNNKGLVLIDFDGTITNKDSFFSFLWMAFPIYQLIVKASTALPFYLAYKTKILSGDVAKEKIFACFFKNIAEDRIMGLGNQFCENCLDKIIRKDALHCLLSYQKEGNEICIVTASSKYWIQAWCNKYHFQLISTTYKVAAGKLTGRYDGDNCRGEIKVIKIKERYNLNMFKNIVCYGDSKDDLPMLALGTSAYYKHFEQ